MALLLLDGGSYGTALVQALAGAGRLISRWETLVAAADIRGVDMAVLARVDGVITRNLHDPHLIARLRTLGCPVVQIGDDDDDPAWPRVGSDNHALGRVQAEHLIGQGHRHLASVTFGEDRPLWAHRRAGVEEVALGHGHAVEVQRIHATSDIITWLSQITAPIAIAAGNDQLAGLLVQACHTLGLAVPQDVSIIGIDDDPLWVSNHQPYLTTVAQDYGAVLRAALLTLAHLLAGRPVPSAHLILPGALVERGSTDHPGGSDPQWLAVAEAMRRHACHGLTVQELAEAGQVSRRSLFRLVHQHLGTTPQEAIAHVQLREAQHLLATTTLSLAEVSIRTGFSRPSRLSEAFRRHLGMTPSAWRHHTPG